MKKKLTLLLLAVLFLSIGTQAANGDVLFSQNFNSATATDFKTSTTRSWSTSNTLANLVGSGANLFTSISAASQSSSGMAINSKAGGNSVDATGILQVVKKGNSAYWSICRTSDFANVAPTALKISMKIWFDNTSSGSNYAGVQFAVGDGFTDGTLSSSPQDASKVHSGFCITDESSPKFAQYNAAGTKIYNTAITESTWHTITWIINNSGSKLTYTGPDASSKTLDNDKFDLWLGTTRIVEGQSATTASIDLQNIFIGSGGAKQHEFRLDDVVVTDLTPEAVVLNKYAVTHTLTNVTTTSGANGADAATEATEYTAVFAAAAGYALPNSISVTVGGSDITANCTWNKSTGTVTIPAAYVTGAIVITIVGVEVPREGELFNLTVKSDASTYSVPANSETNMVSSYATVTGGYAYVGNKSTSSAGAAQVKTDGSGTVYFNSNDGYIKIVLNFPLMTGDVMTFVNGNGSNQISFTKEKTRGTTYATSSNIYFCGSEFNGENTLYIWRASGSSTYLHSLRITRGVEVSIGSTGWATFCSPGILDLTDAKRPVGLTAYQVEATGVNSTAKTIAPTEVTSAVIANTGLLLNGAEGTYYIQIAASGSNLSSTNKLVAVTADNTKIKDANKFVLVDLGDGNAGFAHTGTNQATLKKGKAYLDLTGVSLAAPEAFRLVDEENNATNIEQVKGNDNVVKFVENGQLLIKRDGVVYDAMGRIVRK